MSDARRRRELRGVADGPDSGPAITLARTVEHELVPRLLLAHRAGPHSPRQVALAVELITQADLDSYLSLVLNGGDEALDRFVTAIIDRGATVDAVFLDLITPTARTLGERWVEDACDFVEVTFALGRLQRALRLLSHAFAAPAATASAGRLLLSSVPGEQHTLGLLMVGEFLIRDGWEVTIAFPGDRARPHDLARTDSYDVVAFSASCDSSLPHLRREIADVRRYSRNPKVGIMVGGRCFTEHPELVARVGGDATAVDGRAVSDQARALLTAMQS